MALLLAGALSAGAAPLDVAGKNNAELSARKSTLILKPSETRSRFTTGVRWRKATVGKIIPAARVPAHIGEKGLSPAKPAGSAQPVVAVAPREASVK